MGLLNKYGLGEGHQEGFLEEAAMPELTPSAGIGTKEGLYRQGTDQARALHQE